MDYISRSGNFDKETNTYMVPYVPYINKDTDKTPSPITVQVPGSKSITNRALLLSTLASGTSVLRGALFSDDSRHFLKCVQDLGFTTDVDENSKTITVTGLGGGIPKSEASIYVGSAGTAARFLTAYLGISDGTYHIDASPQMRRRPMAPLLDSLKELGCEIIYDESVDSEEGHFPFTLKSHGFGQNTITVDIEHSSQFLSALLISSFLAADNFTIKINGAHGMSYIDMTCRMMEQFGVKVRRTSPDTFVTDAGQHFKALDYRIEPDVSAACYFYACSPLLNVPIMVEHVHFDSLQGDVRFIGILEQMGCKASDTDNGIVLLPPSDGILKGITADMSACSDQAITLAAIAPFADSPTTITGIGHIRFQESDRINAIATELGRMGIRCDTDSAGQGSITIYPGIPKPCVIETYDDHRIAMGFSLTGLRTKGMSIHNPGCCRKTFENYFDVLENLCATICADF